MSTNYYARLPEYGPDDSSLHVGKQSAGWDFLFRAYPDLGLVDCSAWLRFLSCPGVLIVAEDGAPITAQEFWPMATKRPADCSNPRQVRSHSSEWAKERNSFYDPLGKAMAARRWVDEHGHPFAAYEFC